MRRFRAKSLSLLATVVLVVAMMPVIPASGDVGITKSVPAKAATLETHATPEGIQLVAKNFASGVTLDFYRSETLGVAGAKLNDQPVSDTSFLDKTAVAGVQYYYTAKLSEGSASPASARFKSLTTTQVKSKVLAAAKAPRQAPARKATQARAPMQIPAFKAPANPVSEAMIRQIAKTTIAPSGPITVNANVTWTLAGSPYYIKNDVTLASGKTLTIQPGVKVYFGDGISVSTGTNPTDGVDLIIHGKLVANGTLTKKIIFTSIAAAAEQAGGAYVPASGHWGYLYFDKRWASQISYAEIMYGYGIWSQGTGRPYVLNSRITNTGGNGVYMIDPYVDATTPRPKFIGNTIMPSGNNDGIYVYASNKATEGIVLNPYIAYNTIQAAYCVDLEVSDVDDSKYGNNIVMGTLYKNKLTSTTYEAVYLQATTRAYKSAKVLTKFVGNTIDSQQSDDDCVFAKARNSTYGPAVVSPTFSGDHLHAYSYAADFEAYSDESSDRLEGNVTINPTFSHSNVTGAWSDAIYLYASTSNKGKATVSPRILSSDVESADSDGLYIYANSDRGQTFTVPYVSSSTLVSSDGGTAIDVSAYGRAWTVASPKIYNSTVLGLDYYGVSVYAKSQWSQADVKPYIDNSTIRSYDQCLYLDAYGSDSGGLYTGAANMIPVVLDSSLYSFYSDGIYAFAETSGRGPATSSPIVTGSYVTADDGYGIDAEAYTVNAPAYASPVVTDSHMASYDVCLYAYAKRDVGGDATIDRTAYSSPKVKHSTLNSTYYPALEAYAYNHNKGKAYVRPVVDHSTLLNQYDDDCVYLYANKNQNLAGDSIVEPVFTSSHLKGEDDGMYISATGSGPNSAARVIGSVSGTTIRSPQEYGVDVDCTNNDAVNGGGVSEFKTAFTNVTIDSQDNYAIYGDVDGGGLWPKITQASPSVTGGQILSGDGIEVYASITNAAQSGKTLVAPRVVNCPIQASWDYPLYAYASTNGHGTASSRAYMYNSPVYAYYAVSMNAHSVGGSAYDASEVRGVSATNKMRIEALDDDAVYVHTWSDAINGIAKSTGKFRYLSCSPYNSPVSVWVGAANGTAQDYTYVGYNVADAKWGFTDYGVEINASGKNLVAHPTVRNNTLYSPEMDGIHIQDSAVGGTCSSTPVVLNNRITQSAAAGIHLSCTTNDANNATVTGNKVKNAKGAGIELWGYRDGLLQENVIDGTGVGSTSTAPSLLAGIFWSDAKTAQIWHNTIMHAQYAVGFDDLAGNVSLHWNNFGGYYGKTDGSWDRPYNIYVETATAGGFKVDARYNWWSTTSLTQIADTIDVQGGTPSSYVNYTSPSAGYMPL